jgi:hypothetical protein
VGDDGGEVGRGVGVCDGGQGGHVVVEAGEDRRATLRAVAGGGFPPLVVDLLGEPAGSGSATCPLPRGEGTGTGHALTCPHLSP